MGELRELAGMNPPRGSWLALRGSQCQEHLKCDPSIGYRVSKLSHAPRAADREPRTTNQQSVSVRQVEHTVHQRTQFPSHQHSSLAIDDEVDRNAHRARRLRLCLARIPLDSATGKRGTVTPQRAFSTMR